MKKEKKNENKKMDKMKLFTRIMAGLLALMMVVSVFATLIYYVVLG